MRWAATGPLCLARGTLCACLAFGCQRGADTGVEGSAALSASAEQAPDTAPATFGKNSVAAPMPTDKPMLGITSFVAIVYEEPKDTSRRIGYLRAGAKVPRGAESAGTKGCKDGWYEVLPRGYVCVGKDATLELDHPILLAAARRPDLGAALPYRYGFVRAVLPLYVRVPTKAEQEKSEFKLKDHLAWYEASKKEVDRMKLGAFDVPLDDRGVPLRGKQVGDLGQRKTSLELGLGELFGGASENDPIPFWLQDGKRLIPNIADFEVPELSVFADRARRFSGLGLVGSFPTGEESLNRRFAITTDLRLAPTTKLKPDSGSPWHGIEIQEASELPFAFVREQGAVRFTPTSDSVSRGQELPHRGVVKLTGKLKRIASEKYYATHDGDLVRANDVGLVVAPRTFPKAAEAGEKWIEINTTEQTLVMWEGKRPIYATLVSTGREEYPTITGEFRIKNKHITATMDSNESSDVGGGSPIRSRTASRAPNDDAPLADKKPRDAKAKESEKPSKSAPGKAASKKDEAAKKDRKAAKPGSAKPGTTAKPGAAPVVPKKGDGEYGITKRRGEGTYQLRDVPYIQYFAAGYALHAAYWHDVFGKSRSHGCINLSPIDAHRVFMWTEPAVPDGWHAIHSGEQFGEGTLVIVHE